MLSLNEYLTKHKRVSPKIVKEKWPMWKLEQAEYSPGSSFTHVYSERQFTACSVGTSHYEMPEPELSGEYLIENSVTRRITEEESLQRRHDEWVQKRNEALIEAHKKKVESYESNEKRIKERLKQLIDYHDERLEKRGQSQIAKEARNKLFEIAKYQEIPNETIITERWWKDMEKSVANKEIREKIDAKYREIMIKTMLW